MAIASDEPVWASEEPVWISESESAAGGPLASIERALHELEVPVAVANGLVSLLACHNGHRRPGSAATCTGAGSTDSSESERREPARREPARREPESVCRESLLRSRAPVTDEQALTSDILLDAARGARVVQSFADAILVQAARSLADRAGRELLGRKGAASPTELVPTARQRWRAKTKSVVAHELATLTGYGVNACHARVAFALAPRAAIDPAERALFEGLTDWRSVAQYWQRCRAMDVEKATEVVDTVFGPLAESTTPDDADPNESPGQSSGSRLETWQEFRRRLDREATRVEGRDAAAERERRRVARDMRDARAEIAADGTGTLYISAGTASVVASIERIETIARRARGAGDQRSLAQIRSDTTMALLVHGILPFGDQTPESSAGSCGPNTTDGLGGWTHRPSAGSLLLQTPDNVCRIISGLPNASVEVVVPISALLGDDAVRDSVDGDGEGDGDVRAGASAGGARADAGAVVDAGARADAAVDAGARADADAAVDAGGRAGAGARADADAAGLASVFPHSPTGSPGQRSVAEIPGHTWVSPAYARELMISPGTTLHRLLTDPVDGRLIERTTKAYRPDAAMRAHVQALDRRCRAPGCTMPAHRCELDHEVPFGNDDGVTCATNLNPKHSRHHQLKTEQFWTSTMDNTRAVTWTTLFGRMYTTYPHDYREYVEMPGADQATVGAATGAGPDLRDQLIYAALSSREGRDNWLEAMDDDPENPEGQWNGVPLSLFHRDGGCRRRGAPPHQESVGQLLGVEPMPATLEGTLPRVIDPGPAPF